MTAVSCEISPRPATNDDPSGIPLHAGRLCSDDPDGPEQARGSERLAKSGGGNSIHRRRPWTEREDAILRERYLAVGAAAMAVELGRHIKVVAARAHRLGMGTHRRWTPAEETHLRMSWGELSVEELAKRFNRSMDAVCMRARQMGLPGGVGFGMEYFSAAAERTGYHRDTLKAILEWAGAKIRRSMSRPVAGPVKYRRLMVDAFDVDQAISEWLETEVVNQAALRRGVPYKKLVNWLMASEREIPKPPKRRRSWWRVPTETIDAVIADRRRRETMNQASKRVGLNKYVLAHLMREAGFKRSTAYSWLLEPEDVDRVVAAYRAKIGGAT